MRNRTLLHCIPSLGGGGAERQLSLLAPALQSMGWSNHVAYARAGSNLDAIVAAGVPTTRVGSGRVGSPITLLQVYRLVGSLRPAIVQTWLPHMDIIGGAAALAHRARWLISERTSSAAYGPGIGYRVRERLGRRADCVVANSRAGASFWEGIAPGVRRLTIPNAVPQDQIQARICGVREQARLRAQPTIVTAGRFAPEKDPLTVISAIGAVLQEDGRVRAALFGEGEMESEVRSLVASLPADAAARVSIAGYTRDLWTQLAAADVFVSMSFFEGNPNVVLEAAACECPLVLSDIPAHREIFDEGSAYFVAPRDPVDLARVLARALNDQAEAGRRARAAAALVAQRSVAQMARQYDSVYRALLEEVTS